MYGIILLSLTLFFSCGSVCIAVSGARTESVHVTEQTTTVAKKSCIQELQTEISPPQTSSLQKDCPQERAAPWSDIWHSSQSPRAPPTTI